MLIKCIICGDEFKGLLHAGENSVRWFGRKDDKAICWDCQKKIVLRVLNEELV